MTVARLESTGELVVLEGWEDTTAMRASGEVYRHRRTGERVIPCGGFGTRVRAHFRNLAGNVARERSLLAMLEANRLARARR